ncbi:MAG: hypothetical protein JRH20_27125 [Deltaproteobacteria bacterium]|nr:hypothetical protein [Deltaproteobacteria bacterium]
MRHFEGGNGGLPASMEDCYAVGAVNGDIYHSGLIGFFSNNSDSEVRIMHCYAAGAITGTSTNGLFGYFTANASAVVDSYWDTEATGQASSPAGTAEAMVATTYVADLRGPGFDSPYEQNLNARVREAQQHYRPKGNCPSQAICLRFSTCVLLTV